MSSGLQFVIKQEDVLNVRDEIRCYIADAKKFFRFIKRFNHVAHLYIRVYVYIYTVNTKHKHKTHKHNIFNT
jgi:hypothetical protein